MKRGKILLLAAGMAAVLCMGCSANDNAGTSGGLETARAAETTTAAATQAAAQKKPLTMWFWGASDYQREAFNNYLVKAFNESQDEYELTVEYRASVDTDISVALSGGGGPDIVYGSGPAFVAGYAAEGLFLDLDEYSQKYGWKDRVLEPCYEICTVDGKLYSIPGAITSTGVFYNKKVLEDNGWEVPKTYDELIMIMDAAKEKGMYAGLTGAKDWRYTSEMYIGMMLTHVAGPEVMYNVLTGQQKWNSPEVKESMDVLVDWYQKGYLAGEDYWNFDFNEASQMLATGKSPFFFGALNVFQFIKNTATEEQCDNIGFFPLPNYDGSTDRRASLGAICSFSINAQSPYPEGAAMVLDRMLTADFSAGISSQWPGYWGMPIHEFDEVNADDYSGMSKEYILTCKDIVSSLQAGNFAYGAATCFPASTYEACIDIDTVWFGDATVEEYLDKMDQAFAEDQANKAIATIPKPSGAQ